MSHHPSLNGEFGLEACSAQAGKVATHHRKQQKTEHCTLNSALPGEQDVEAGNRSIGAREKGGHLWVIRGVAQQITCSVDEHREEDKNREGVHHGPMPALPGFMNGQHWRDGPKPTREEQQGHQPPLFLHQHELEQRHPPFGRGGRPKDERLDQHP